MSSTHFSGPVVSTAGFQGGTSSVESLTAAKTMTSADDGKTFFLNLAGGFTVTLPTPTAGLKLKFIVGTAPTTAYIISQNDAEHLIGGANELETDTGDDGPYSATGDAINFVASTAVVGDWIELISDGTNWYWTGQAQADGGISITAA